MVTVSAYNVRHKKDGSSFITLELSGGLEFATNQTTGKSYATIRRCSIPTSFDEQTAKQLVGTQMPGNIVRVETEPYEFVANNEVMLLSHTYSFEPIQQAELISNQTPQHSF